jgi:hypothetical protein
MGRQFGAQQGRRIEIVAIGYMPLTDWKKFHRFYFQRPRCRLLGIDLQDGTRTVIYETRQWLQSIYRPFDDRTVAFCHEWSHDVVDARVWLVNEDGTDVCKLHVHDAVHICTCSSRPPIATANPHCISWICRPETSANIHHNRPTPPRGRPKHPYGA